MKKIKIGCLTYKKLDMLTRQVMKEIEDPDIEIIVIEGLMEELIAKVKKIAVDGLDVLVGGGANAEIIQEIIGIPVVKIRNTANDYFEAIIKGKQFGRKIAIVSYQSPPTFDFERFNQLLDVEVSIIVFSSQDDLEMKLKNSDIDVVIGASLSNEIAFKLNIPSVLIYPGKDTVIKYIEEAKKMAVALYREKEKSKLFQVMLSFTPSGVIATDENGKIIIFNPSAEKILGIHSSKVMGIPLHKVLPECDLENVLVSKKPQLDVVIQVNNKEVVVNRVPIDYDGSIIGALATIEKVSEIQKTEQKIRLMNIDKGFTAKSNFSDIIGDSKLLLNEIEKAKRYSQADSSILIFGETGVGKEVFAQSIHNYSNRQKRPFVAINCAALPENLLESELFGYDEGAFTGSRKGGKMGLFELAHEGTIFLDEIAEISLPLQARLLRVLQEKEVMRIGGDRVIPIDVRIIAATNKNLEDKIPNEFREDLYYRLNVLQINIPPLRERSDDVIKLFNYFFKKNLKISNRNIDINEESLNILKLYSWPGNIRQLQNVVERFSIDIKEIFSIDDATIRETIISSIGEERLFNDILRIHGIDIKKGVDTKLITKSLIEQVMLIFPRQKSKIAEKLGISRTTLWRMMNN